MYETATPPLATFSHSVCDFAVGRAANARNADGSTPSTAVSLPFTADPGRVDPLAGDHAGQPPHCGGDAAAQGGGRDHEQVRLEQPTQRRDGLPLPRAGRVALRNDRGHRA